MAYGKADFAEVYGENREIKAEFLQDVFFSERGVCGILYRIANKTECGLQGDCRRCESFGGNI